MQLLQSTRRLTRPDGHEQVRDDSTYGLFTLTAARATSLVATGPLSYAALNE